MEKKISEMTEKEILRQQLELLAERSKSCVDDCLAEITTSMISIFTTIENEKFIPIVVELEILTYPVPLSLTKPAANRLINFCDN